MPFAEVLSALYAASGIAGCACYVPQVLGLARNAPARRAMSLATWSGWLGLSLIGVAYAMVVVGQPELILVTSLNALGQAVVVALVAGQRLKDCRETKRAGTLAVPAR
ncbi:MAG TPA: hypothetical protein VK196_14045 [Magnetospirillum sp.]|nr:hypothetical protein [Magnetospirillum sp.]